MKFQTFLKKMISNKKITKMIVIHLTVKWSVKYRQLSVYETRIDRNIR